MLTWMRRRLAGAADRRERIYTPSIMLLAMTVGISFLGLGFVMPLRALYAQDIGASSVEIGLMASSALLTGFLAAPGIGWLGDRLGHRNVLWVSVLVHGALVLAYIPVRDPVLLIGLRGLEGIAIVGVLPPSRALMNGLAPSTRQGEALGLISSAQMVGILMGPAAGTLLASDVGYTQAFLVASVPLLLGAIAARLFLPARAEHEAATGGMVLFGELFTRPLLLVYGICAAVAVSNGVIQAIWSIYMLQRGASLPAIGLSYTAYAVPTALLTPLAGRLSDRRGRFWPVVVGMLLYAAIYVTFGLPISPFWLIVFSAAEGFAAAFARSALDGLLADVTPVGARGKAQANYSAAGTAGSFVGATAAGFLYALGPGAPFTATGVLFLMVAGALFLPVVGRIFPARAEVA